MGLFSCFNILSEKQTNSTIKDKNMYIEGKVYSLTLMHEEKITEEERNVDVVIKHLNTKQLIDRMVLGERDFFKTDLFVKKSSKLLKC